MLVVVGQPSTAQPEDDHLVWGGQKDGLFVFQLPSKEILLVQVPIITFDVCENSLGEFVLGAEDGCVYIGRRGETEGAIQHDAKAKGKTDADESRDIIKGELN